jgi:hypothetical protein
MAFTMTPMSKSANCVTQVALRAKAPTKLAQAAVLSHTYFLTQIRISVSLLVKRDTLMTQAITCASDARLGVLPAVDQSTTVRLVSQQAALHFISTSNVFQHARTTSVFPLEGVVCHATPAARRVQER